MERNFNARYSLYSLAQIFAAFVRKIRQYPAQTRRLRILQGIAHTKITPPSNPVR